MSSKGDRLLSARAVIDTVRRLAEEIEAKASESTDGIRYYLGTSASAYRALARSLENHLNLYLETALHE